jgi:signal peptidase II
MTRKTRIFWPLFLVFVTTDCASKDMALEHLAPHRPVAIFDSVVRFTLVQNPNAAFSTDLGRYFGRFERPALILMMLGVVALLVHLYRRTPPRARLAAVGFALAFGGAFGNIIDRFRYSAGVVDFIDVGIGSTRYWICNLADAWIFLGAVILGLAMLRADRAETSEAG